ncbi:major facilitator superfamily domain-containing protein [Nemania abortiva]|nr:major facilitator superfamily domain-containing protein [Nemania abortiva]
MSMPSSGSSTMAGQDVEAAHLARLAGEKQDSDEDANLVTWDGPKDPENPQNYSVFRKLFITFVWVYSNLVTTIASSIWSSGSGAVQEEFHKSTIVGYAVGPPVWGPLSERFGRKWPMTVGVALFTAFSIGGAFGAAPLSLSSGGLVDIWSPEHRGAAISASVATIFGAPILSPIIGNFVAASYLGWRWTHWLSAIMGGSSIVLAVLGLPETLASRILQLRAARIRQSTNPNAKTAFDNQKQLGFANIVRVYLMRPFMLLATEPILVLVTIYQAFIYGILYLVFESYPIEFHDSTLGPGLGVILGAVAVIWHAQIKSNSIPANGSKLVPEQRLPIMIVGGCILPPSTHWSGMVVASIPTGMGMYMVFVQCFNYIIDVYAPIANSAVGGNTFVRSFFGAGFPLFAPYLYHNLGVAWVTSTLGFISIALIPIPILLYKFGHRIRSWSKNSINGV